jgi:hypothetical protein
MSEKLLRLVWTNFPGGGSRLLVLQAVAEAANDQGNCYPSLAQLALAARTSRSNVWRALKRLRQERWVVADRILGRNGVLVLQINLPKLARSTRLESRKPVRAAPAKPQVQCARSVRRPETRLNLLTGVRLY